MKSRRRVGPPTLRMYECTPHAITHVHTRQVGSQGARGSGSPGGPGAPGPSAHSIPKRELVSRGDHMSHPTPALGLLSISPTETVVDRIESITGGRSEILVLHNTVFARGPGRGGAGRVDIYVTNVLQNCPNRGCILKSRQIHTEMNRRLRLVASSSTRPTPPLVAHRTRPRLVAQRM